MELVGTAPAVDEVGAAAAVDLVGSRSGVNDVVAEAGKDPVVAGPGKDPVGPDRPADQVVVAERADRAPVLGRDLAEREAPVLVVDVVGEVAVESRVGSGDLRFQWLAPGDERHEAKLDRRGAAGRERGQRARDVGFGDAVAA